MFFSSFSYLFNTGYMSVGLSISLVQVLFKIRCKWFQSWPYFYSCQLLAEAVLVSLYEKQPRDLSLQICNCVSDATNAHDKLKHQLGDAW